MEGPGARFGVVPTEVKLLSEAGTGFVAVFVEITTEVQALVVAGVARDGEVLIGEVPEPNMEEPGTPSSGPADAGAAAERPDDKAVASGALARMIIVEVPWFAMPV